MRAVQVSQAGGDFERVEREVRAEPPAGGRVAVLGIGGLGHLGVQFAA